MVHINYCHMHAMYAPIPNFTSGDEIQLASKSACNISCSNNKHYCEYIPQSHQHNETIMRKKAGHVEQTN
jgi:hypothetical protein